MMKSKSQQSQRDKRSAHAAEVEAFLVRELREIFLSPWESLSLSREHVSRLSFEVGRALGELRKILLSPLNAEDLKTLFGSVRAAATEQANKARLQIDAVISAENKSCEQLREQTAQIELDRRAFAARPEVVEAKRQHAELTLHIGKLNGEIAHARGNESRLLSLCQVNGIDPRLPSASG
jgi:hypothetical protein